MSSDYKELVSWLRLIRSENIGPKTFDRLLRLYGSVERALHKAPEMSVKGGRRTPLKICGTEQAEAEIEFCRDIGAEMITRNDERYPKLLAQIPDSPPVITIIGQFDDSSVPALERDCIAMVGARNASANGYNIAQRLARELSEAGYTVISGLARGIDTAAHKGALGKSTVAVVAGGIEHIYPPENAGLREEIMQCGVIIAESLFGAVPRSESFPRRNRIISGLCLGTVIIEAATRSGSLITARFAAEQGREVMAIPGSPMDPRAEGPNRLLKQGATLVESAQDIIDAVRFSSERTIPNALLESSADDYEYEEFTGDADDIVTEGSEFEKLRTSILDNLGTVPVNIDNLVNMCNADTASAANILLELELAGRLARHPGNRVSLLVEG